MNLLHAASILADRDVACQCDGFDSVYLRSVLAHACVESPSLLFGIADGLQICGQNRDVARGESKINLPKIVQTAKTQPHSNKNQGAYCDLNHDQRASDSPLARTPDRYLSA